MTILHHKMKNLVNSSQAFHFYFIFTRNSSTTKWSKTPLKNAYSSNMKMIIIMSLEILEEEHKTFPCSNSRIE